MYFIRCNQTFSCKSRPSSTILNGSLFRFLSSSCSWKKAAAVSPSSIKQITPALTDSRSRKPVQNGAANGRRSLPTIARENTEDETCLTQDEQGVMFRESVTQAKSLLRPSPPPYNLDSQARLKLACSQYRRSASWTHPDSQVFWRTCGANRSTSEPDSLNRWWRGDERTRQRIFKKVLSRLKFQLVLNSQ